MQSGTDVRGRCHRLDDVVGELGRMRRREPHSLESVDGSARGQQRGERPAVARQIGVGERGTVGVDVLPQQRHLEHALVHQSLYLGEDVARPTVDLLAAQRRNDAERAGVVAAHRNRYPAGVRGLPLGRQGGREGVERLEYLDLSLLVVPGALEQYRQRPDVVRTEDHVHPRSLVHDGVAVLLRQATADGNLHVGVSRLRGPEHAEVPVQLVVRVLAYSARVEHDEICVGTGVGGHVTGLFEQPGQAFGIMNVHLAAVCAHLVAAGTCRRWGTGRLGVDAPAIGHVHGRKNTRLHLFRVRPSHGRTRRGHGALRGLCRRYACRQ